MNVHLSNRFLTLLGISVLVAACNTEDNIADLTDGGGGTGGAAGATGGSGGSSDAGPCENSCPEADATLCMGDRIVTCAPSSYTGCLAWVAGNSCPTGQGCNADGTQCVTPQTACTTEGDCGCGCLCVGNECKCTGAIPPSCTTNDDCGPACSGLVCVGNECVQSSAPCADPCSNAGETRCVGADLETCVDDGAGCLHWGPKTPCPTDQSCNSDGTKCVAAQSTCTNSEDCGCGCGCVANECKCTGAIPPSCTTDDDCGPVCAGFSCIAEQCVQL